METHLIWFTSCNLNILVAGNMAANLKYNSQLIVENISLGTPCEIALRWMPQKLTD